MNPRDGSDYENNTITADTTEDSPDYIDTYDEKSGQSAIGRLFVEDDESTLSQPKRVAPKKTPASKMGDTDYYKQINATRAARGDRSRPATPTSATQKVEKAVVRTNPEPKPAMKARVPVVREPITTRRVADDTDPYTVSIENDVEHMKTRYSGGRDAIATARDPGSPARTDADDRVLHPVGAKTRPRGSTAATQPMAFENINPIRWIALAGVVVAIIFMVVLLFQNRGLSRERDELLAAGEANPIAVANGNAPATAPNGVDVTQMEVQIAALEDSLAAVRAELSTLEGWVRAQGLDPNHAINPPAPDHTPPPVTPDPPPPPPPPPYDVHYVTTGQTLSGIAQLFYGSSGLYSIIAEANSIPPPFNLSIGQRLIIPRLNTD